MAGNADLKARLMAVSLSSKFVHLPRIRVDTFRGILVAQASPWASLADELYDLIAIHGQDPAVWLAIAAEEHNYGTNKNSVLWRNQTNSWTNARTVRLKSLTGWEIITDAIRGSNYVRYRSVQDSLRDGMFRVVDPTFVYVREGRTSIEQVIHRWTEGDGERYANAVIRRMNEYIRLDWKDDPVPTGDMLGVPFIPADDGHMTEGRSVAWPDLIVLHHTDGRDSLDWLTVSADSNVSATYLTYRNGKPRAQLVLHKNTPHTNLDYNPRCLTIEWERKWGDPAEYDIPDETYENLGHLCTEIVLIERRRGNPHFQGIPKREQFKDHNDLYNTVCPGNLDVGRVYALVVRNLERAATVNALFVPETNRWIVNTVPAPMLTAWYEHGGLVDLGWPVLWMELRADGVYEQLFENGLLEIHPDGSVRKGGAGQRLVKLIDFIRQERAALHKANPEALEALMDYLGRAYFGD